MRRLLALALLAACSRRKAIAPDPVEQHVVEDAPPPKRPERVLLHGRILDLDARKVAFELVKKLPRDEGQDDERAYLVDDAGDVRAFDLATGHEKWTAHPPACHPFAIGEHDVFCADASTVRALSKSDGAIRTVSSGAPRAVTALFGFSGRLVVQRGPSDLSSIDLASGVTTAFAGVLGWPGPVASGDGFGAWTRTPSGVDVTTFAPDLGVLAKASVSLRAPGDPAGLSFVALRIENGFAVVGTWPHGTGPHRGAVVALRDGAEVLRVEDQLVAAVGRPDGTLDGALAMDGTTLRYYDREGKVVFSTKAWGDAASGVLDGDRLIVATYTSGASGAELRAFHRVTGALAWTGDVELLPVAHSAYANHVSLASRAGAIAMSGDEAAFSYLELFDRDAGTRLFSEIRMRW